MPPPLWAPAIAIRDAGGTRRSYPVPPVLAREAAPLILRGVANTVAPLALPWGHEGGSRSQHSWHSPHNTHSLTQIIASLYWAALCGVHRGKSGKRGQYLFRSVEPTCVALVLTRIPTRTSKGGKTKEIPSCPCSNSLRKRCSILDHFSLWYLQDLSPFWTTSLTTVHLTSIYNPQIEDKSHMTAAGLTNLFMLARTSLLSELVLATIKKVMAPLEVGQTFGIN